MRLSPRAFAISTSGHLTLLAALLAAASLWRADEAKFYIVNLVPSVAAVGSPQGRPTRAATREEPAPRAARFTPPAVAAPARDRASPRATVKEVAPEVPAPPAPARVPPLAPSAAADAPVTLPEKARNPVVREAPLAPSTPRAGPVVAALPVAPRLPVRPDADEPVQRTTVSEFRPPRELSSPPSPGPSPRLSMRDPTPDVPRRSTPPATPAITDRPRTAPVGPVPPVSDRSVADRAPVEPPGRLGSLPQPGQKELPTLSSQIRSVAPPPIAPPPIPPPRTTPPIPLPTPTAVAAPVATLAVPPTLGLPAGSAHGRGAITMAATDFPFAWYLQTIQRKVNEKWTPPTRSSPGHAVVVFEIDRDGQVRTPALETSSGDTLYDQAALRAIVDAHPFPPLPAEFKQPMLKIHLGFNVTDRG